MDTCGNKIMMQNLPIGTMKSDVKEVILKWIQHITILSIDLVPPKKNSKNHYQNTTNAYIQLKNQLECESVLLYYTHNHASRGGFEFQNSSGQFSNKVSMTSYIGRKNATRTSSSVHDTQTCKLSHPTTIESEFYPCTTVVVEKDSRKFSNDETLKKDFNRNVERTTEGSSLENCSSEVKCLQDGTVSDGSARTVLTLTLEELSKEKENHQREYNTIKRYIQVLESTLKERCSNNGNVKCPDLDLYLKLDAEILDMERQFDALNLNLIKRQELLVTNKKELRELKIDLQQLYQ